MFFFEMKNVNDLVNHQWLSFNSTTVIGVIGSMVDDN